MKSSHKNVMHLRKRGLKVKKRKTEITLSLHLWANKTSFAVRNTV